MKQDETDRFLKKIEKSAQDVSVPEKLRLEQMMKKLEGLEQGQKQDEKPNHYSRRKWSRSAEFGVLAVVVLVMVLAAVQIQNTHITVEPGEKGETATKVAMPEDANTETEAETEAEDAIEEAENPEAKKYIAKSYQEIHQRIKSYGDTSYMDGGIVESPTGADPAKGEAMAGDGIITDSVMKEESAGSSQMTQMEREIAIANTTSKEFSDTNVQVEGVDEGDIVKTDGAYLYIMSSDPDRTQIVEANGSNPKKRGVMSDTSTTRKSRSIQEFYINGDRLSVIRQAYVPYEEDDRVKSYYQDRGVEDIDGMRTIYSYAYPAKSITYLEIYDISNRDNPKLLGIITQDGTHKGFRCVDDDIYLFTIYYANHFQDAKRTESYIPAVNGTVLPYGSIYTPEQVDGAGYTAIPPVNTKNPSKATNQKAVVADGDQFYVSGSNIYIGPTRYDGRANQYDYAELIKLSYKNGRTTFQTHGNTDGYLNDQFPLDEYQGKLCLVSTLSHNNGSSTNSPLVLDENLKVIGEIEDLALGGRIYSTGFIGNTDYFVTFRNMDPLFSVDLKDPKNPKILGELKITGFSGYLHPYDENLPLGISREIGPDTGNFKGLKSSMFDISNPKDVREIRKTVEKSYESSPAWGNHKAVAISSGKRVIGFAVEEYDKVSRERKYNYMVYSCDKNQGFKQVLSYELQDDYNYENVRGLYIGQYFCVVESRRVTVFDMKKFVQTGQVKY